MLPIRLVPTLGLIVLLASGFIFVTELSAAGNLMLGPVEVHPTLGLTESLNDNVCRTKDEKCSGEDGSDSITILSAGVMFVLPIRENSVFAGYNGEFARYATLGDDDYEDNTFHAGVELNFPMDAQLGRFL